MITSEAFLCKRCNKPLLLKKNSSHIEKNMENKKKEEEKLTREAAAKFVNFLEKLIWEVIFEKEHSGESNIKDVKENLVKILMED